MVKRVVFMGTPEFAVPTLERLAAEGFEIAAVYTQPDRPKGRGQQLAYSPVKEAALRLGLRVEQPLKVRAPEVREQLRAFEADAMVVVGYGQIIPQAIIDLPRYGIINVHGSLLPKYRGAAPIQWAIANGESVTGVTTMQINAGLDTGDMLLEWSTPIGAEETAVTLGARMAVAGAELLIDTLRNIESIAPRKQDDAQASYAPILKKEDGRIDFAMPAQQIVNRMRGFQPWPGAYTSLRGVKLSVWNAAVAETAAVVAQGVIVQQGKRLFAGCGEGTAVELLELQMEGRKRLPAAMFLNGFTLSAEGEQLG
ncbi:methionyl-tRNA formyltransferase [Bryobacterales bacterium F-183]|nr:methionyl-tRNA formyltransferase [Bryobacterales bacterium F-183]